MRYFKWISEPLKGRDGKFSYQRLTIFIFTVMFLVTWFAQLFLDKSLDSITLIIIAIVILVGWGILKAEHIVAILKRPSTYYGEDIYSFGRKASDGQDPPVEG